MIRSQIPARYLLTSGAILLASALTFAGCSSGGGGGGGGGGNPPGGLPPVGGAQTSDLSNMVFSFANGLALLQQGQVVTLTFGRFDNSGTAPFQLSSSCCFATGLATLNSPLTLTILNVSQNTPYFVRQQLPLDAGFDQQGLLVLQNLNTSGRSSSSDGGFFDPSTPAVLRAHLSGTQAAPEKIATDGSGTATLSVTAAGDQILFSLEYSDLDNIQQAHLHIGEPGVAGPAIFFLCTALANPGNVPAPLPCVGSPGLLSGTLTASDLIPAAGAGTFGEAVAALLRGDTYVNIHTMTNPSGEIRGQVGPAQLGAELGGDQEVPMVDTIASGRAGLEINATQTELFFRMEYQDTENVNRAHIHVGDEDQNGPVIIFLCTDLGDAPAGVPPPPPCPGAGGFLFGRFTKDDVVNSGLGGFTELISQLLGGETYVNVHSEAHPGGEIRGQIQSMDPSPFPPVSFSADIQPIYAMSCALLGCHTAGVPAANLNLDPGQAHLNIYRFPSEERPDLFRVEPFQPLSSYLFLKHLGDPGISGLRMPLNDPTFFDRHPELLELERGWILEGARDN